MNLRWEQLTIEHSPFLFKWRNLQHVADYQYGDHTITQAEHDDWMAWVLKQTDRHYWVVYDDLIPVGLTGIIDISQKHRRGLFVLYIGERNYLGKGVGTWMTKKTLEYSFDVLNLNKVTVEVFADNEAGVKMYSRNGFIKEGTLRQHIFKNDTPKDVIFMRQTKSEFGWRQVKQGDFTDWPIAASL